MEHGTLFVEKRRYYAICIIICIIILTPTLVIGIYDRPSADDYDYAILTHEAVKNGEGLLGILSAAWETNISFYNNWQGLYTSAFILALQPGIFGEQIYALTPFLVIGWGYIFILLSVHLLNKMYFKRTFLFSVTQSLVLLTLLIIWLPSATEGLYWYNGAMNYMPWVFTNLFNICLLLYIKEKPVSLKVMLFIVFSSLLSFLTSGGNHVTAFANILQLLFLTIYLATKKNCYSVPPFVAACIGFIIMYMAPGTAVRAHMLTQSSVIETIIAVIIEMRVIISDWIDIQWIISLMVITPLCAEFAYKNKGKFSWILSGSILFASIIIICGMFSVPYYAMKGFGAGRVTNVIWITFMFLSWLNYALLLGLLIQKNVINIDVIYAQKVNVTRSLGVLLVCFGILFSVITLKDSNSNSVQAIKELMNGTAKSYCTEMDARFEMYHNPTVTEATVVPIMTSSMLFLDDIGTDPDIWPNTSIGEYYGKPIYIVP